MNDFTSDVWVEFVFLSNTDRGWECLFFSLQCVPIWRNHDC